MTTEETRCTNCGTPLSPDDERCPACGAPVGEETSFPAREEFVHESYQNVEPQEFAGEPTSYPPTSEPVVIDSPAEPASGEPFAASPPVYQTTQGGNSTARTCGIACGVFLLVGLCCLITLAVILWFTGDLVLDILRSMGIYF